MEYIWIECVIEDHVALVRLNRVTTLNAPEL
jgi:hypothetical protein